MDEIKNKKILIVDDEKELLKLLENKLFESGFYHIFKSENCSNALQIAKEQNISLFVLDVNLPDGNGFALYEDIRKFSQSPVIFLTARGEADDRLTGLGLGADDYIVKPFLTSEFVLRVTAVLKRTYKPVIKNTDIKLSDRVINLETASVKFREEVIPLAAKEFIILKKLYENKNRIVTYDALCLAAWGDGYYGYENTLMVHIRRLREKIETAPSKPKHIITVKGLGYKLEVSDNE